MKAGQLILAFAILVIIHEFGHFLFARMFGVKVEKFYMFFNPWFSLFKWKPGEYVEICGKRKQLKSTPEKAEKLKKSFWGNTEYGIGWLPLGGYCKIAGMIDESMDKEQMKQPPQPWEFRTKPAWQRLLIMVAGVLFNFLLAIVIYAGIVYACGEKYVDFKDAEMGMMYSNEAHKAGFKDGDIPLTADGKALDRPDEARMQMLQAKSVQVLRDGKDTVTINIPEKFIWRMEEEAKKGDQMVNFMGYRIPAEVMKVEPGTPAEKAKLQKGDRIVAVDSIATPSLELFLPALQGHANKKVNLTVLRREPGKQTWDTIHTSATLNDNSKLGFQLQIDPTEIYPAQVKNYNLFQSVPRGIQMGTDKLVSYAQSMKLVFSKEGAQSIGGFGTIGSIFPESWDWVAFWNIAAFLSVALAFMNILPIPALDGGHVLFLLYEVITRRKPSEKFLEYAQMVGMALLILLLLYANGMDIVRLFK